jgi:ribosomal protein S18 acetylase RimI-like enzyme
MSNPTIHVMLPADLAQIKQILIDRGNFVAMEIEVAMEVCEEAAIHPFQEYYGYCAKVGEAVAGFIVFGLIPMTDRCWDLYWIAVAPAYARSGVGRMLAATMEKIITDLSGRQIHIDTSSLPTYIPACHFYEKFGFTLEARLKDFYRQGDDKLIYVKVFS